MNLKVSVLSNGSILLDGAPVALSNLKAALEQADKTNGRVLYYRENAGADPPSQSQEVMDLVIANKLPISLSTKPDFSDYVDQFGQVRPRSAGISIVRPDRAILFLALPPPPPQTSLLAKQLASVIPSERGRKIAVIGSTAFTMAGTEAVPSLQEANRAIPFFGLLCGLNYIGHTIWIFDGNPSAFPAGLEQSEILIVDSAMLPSLPADWMQAAQRAMQGDRRIFVHDRTSGRLSEPAGEASYVNHLLTALGKGSAASVEITPGTTVPNLAGLPFRYESLDAQKVIDILLTAAGRTKLSPFQEQWTLKTKLVVKGQEPRLITFVLRLEAGKSNPALVIGKL